jgi:hypothetical protein
MAVTFNVTAGYDKAAYAQGETITATITGDATNTSQSVGTAGPLDLTIRSASGVEEVIHMDIAPISIETITQENVVIVAVADTNATPRSWAISGDGKSVAAVA